MGPGSARNNRGRENRDNYCLRYRAVIKDHRNLHENFHHQHEVIDKMHNMIYEQHELIKNISNIQQAKNDSIEN